MLVVIPIAGHDQRFGDDVYTPFVRATDELIVQLAAKPFLQHLEEDVDLVFACTSEQEAKHNVSARLAELFPGRSFRLHLLQAPTRGPFETVKLATQHLSLSGRAFVCDCDHMVNIKPMLPALMDCSDVDVVVPTWTYPDKEQHAFAKVTFDKHGTVAHFYEKETPYLLDGEQSEGMLGCFFFSDIGTISKSPPFSSFSSLFNVMLAEGRRFLTVAIKQADFFGSPSQLQAFRFSLAQTYTIFCDIDGCLVSQETAEVLDGAGKQARALFF